MGTRLEKILDVLRLERLDTMRFEGRNFDIIGHARTYGGQLLAQALEAANQVFRTPTLRCHSLQCYFLRPGRIEQPLQFEVQLLKKGRAFVVCEVRVEQGSHLICSVRCSFQEDEAGLSHQMPMPEVPAPETLTPLHEITRSMRDMMPEHIARHVCDADPFMEARSVEAVQWGSSYRTPRRHIWFKAHGQVPLDPNCQQAFLTYWSDQYLLFTSLIPHGLYSFQSTMRVASLDHAMWFHSPDVDLNQWHLYVMDSPFSGGGRGIGRGLIYRHDGLLVATVNQEGLIRKLS